MFRFATPYAFLLLIPWGIAAWRLFRRGARSALLFAPMHRLPARTAGWRSVVARLLPMIFVLGAGLLIVAAARPQTFFARERRTVDALAIAMAVDVSGSMEALDLTEGTPTGANAQTRLDVVKTMFARFIEQRPDDLIALIAFGGYASTRSPLTADHPALLQILKATSIPKSEFDEQGRAVSQEELLTAIGDGLATACARLQDAEPRTRVVVLLSDGESNTGIITPEQAAETAAKLGFRVYTIGVGTTGRAPFKTRDAFGREVVGYAEVRLNEVQLKLIAEKTSGRYFNVRDTAGFKEALDAINALETTRISRNVYNQYDEKFLPFLALGALLTTLSVLLNLFIVQRPL
jgi:Ca-activated chloride channel family protein